MGEPAGTPTREDTDVLTERIVAYLIDVVGLYVVYFLVAGLPGITVMTVLPDGDVEAALVVGYHAVPWLYFLCFEGLWDGYTVGKRAVGIRVRREDGTAIGLRESAVRNGLRLVDQVGNYLVGYLFVARSDRRQRLGDRVASTVVVRERRAGRSDERETAEERGPGTPR